MSYAIFYGPGVSKDMSRLPREVLRRVDKAIVMLGQTPRPSGCKKLSGQSSLYRVRVGDWRIVYEIDDARQRIAIRIVANRREVYRDL